VQPLLALDLPLGSEFGDAVAACVERGEAFCVLDRRLSKRQRDKELLALGATAVLDSSGRSLRPEGRMVDDEVGLVMLTSGSSGPPRAAELTWLALRASADLTQRALDVDGVAVWLPCLPANHIGGLAVLLRAAFTDATLLWGDPDRLDDAPARGATHVAVVRRQLARFGLDRYRRVLLGGACPPENVARNVVATWGMTETGSGIVYNGAPLPGVQVAAMDGELLVRTPTLFRSYRDAPRPAALGPDGRDDWFPTGDAGSVKNGRVSVRGRLGSVINSGGEKLWPEDLEAALATVAGVRDVAVTGIADPEWGEGVVALIVSNGEHLDEALRDAAAEAIGPWAKPKEIRYVTAIPRTGNGKIRRGDLANLR